VGETQELRFAPAILRARAPALREDRLTALGAGLHRTRSAGAPARKSRSGRKMAVSGIWPGLFWHTAGREMATGLAYSGVPMAHFGV